MNLQSSDAHSAVREQIRDVALGRRSLVLAVDLDALRGDADVALEPLEARARGEDELAISRAEFSRVAQAGAPQIAQARRRPRELEEVPALEAARVRDVEAPEGAARDRTQGRERGGRGGGAQIDLAPRRVREVARRLRLVREARAQPSVERGTPALGEARSAREEAVAERGAGGERRAHGGDGADRASGRRSAGAGRRERVALGAAARRHARAVGGGEMRQDVYGGGRVEVAQKHPVGRRRLLRELDPRRVHQPLESHLRPRAPRLAAELARLGDVRPRPSRALRRARRGAAPGRVRLAELGVGPIRLRRRLLRRLRGPPRGARLDGRETHAREGVREQRGRGRGVERRHGRVTARRTMARIRANVQNINARAHERSAFRSDPATAARMTRNADRRNIFRLGHLGVPFLPRALEMRRVDASHSPASIHFNPRIATTSTS